MNNILRQLHYAISHSHILFEKDIFKDSDEKARISTVIFVSCEFIKWKSQCPPHSNCWDCKLKNNSNAQPDFLIKIPVNELRKCVNGLANEIIKSVDTKNKPQKANTKGSR